MNRKIRRALLTLVAVILFLPQSVSAQDQGMSLGFAIEKDRLVLEPGQVYNSKFTIWNLGENSVKYYLYVSGFEQIENFPGTAIPLSEEDDANDPYSASSWVTTDIDVIDLVPQKNEDIFFSIKVPDNVALGEYTAKIFLATQKQYEDIQETKTFTNLGAGPNLLIQIGDISELSEELDLIKFYTKRFLYAESDVQFLTEFENTGNTHVRPMGDLVITNIFGQEVARIPFNKARMSMLRGSRATYRTDWKSDYEFMDREGRLIAGPLKTKIILTYKQVSPGYSPIMSELTFWIIPWKHLLAFIGVGTVITLIVKKKLNRK